MSNSLCWNSLALADRGDARRNCRPALDYQDRLAHIVWRMMREAEAVANALGVVLPRAMEKCKAATASARVHSMSMLQDLTRGQPPKIDVLACSLRIAVQQSSGVS